MDRGVHFLFVIFEIVPHGTVNVDFSFKVFFRCGLEVGTKIAPRRLAHFLLSPPPPGGGGGWPHYRSIFFIVKRKIVWCLMKVTKLETQTQLKISRKKPCRELSSRTIPHVPEFSGKIRRKLACGLQFGQTEKTASPFVRRLQCQASSKRGSQPRDHCHAFCW